MNIKKDKKGYVVYIANVRVTGIKTVKQLKEWNGKVNRWNKMAQHAKYQEAMKILNSGTQFYNYL